MADLAYTDTAEPRRSLRLALSGERFQVLAFVGVAALVVGFVAAGGGYFPTAWGWTALALMWVAALALMLAPAIELTRLELGALAGWSALAAWTWLSIAWSKDVNQSVLEGERLLVFVAGVGALVLLARRLSASTVIGGVLAGITAVSAYSLATRLFPERIGHFDSVAGYQLAAPIGYWNSLGLQLADARASFGKAIDKAPRDWELWLDLARASEGRAQLAALDRASRLNPLSPAVALFRKELAEIGTIQVGSG